MVKTIRKRNDCEDKSTDLLKESPNPTDKKKQKEVTGGKSKQKDLKSMNFVKMTPSKNQDLRNIEDHEEAFEVESTDESIMIKENKHDEIGKGSRTIEIGKSEVEGHDKDTTTFLAEPNETVTPTTNL